jgi:hypothetical protein
MPFCVIFGLDGEAMSFCDQYDVEYRLLFCVEVAFKLASSLLML